MMMLTRKYRDPESVLGLGFVIDSWNTVCRGCSFFAVFRGIRYELQCWLTHTTAFVASRTAVRGPRDASHVS